MIFRKHLDILSEVFDQVFSFDFGFFKFRAAVVEIAEEVL